MTRRIDLNADAGEGFGRWSLADEDALFPQLTSVNLACGFHAGDPATMLASLERARRWNLAVGAHPGYPDRVGFGRRSIAASPTEIYADVAYQIGALASLARTVGVELHHVKAHGALYNDMAATSEVADAVARAVADAAAGLPLVVLAGPGGTTMRGAATSHGLRAVAEGFPDRGYLRNGRLAPRSMEGGVVTDPDEIASRALRMARGDALEALDGGDVLVEAETLCLHGDGSTAHAAAKRVRDALHANGIELVAF